MLRAPRDPRLYQIACLSALASYGMLVLDLEVRAPVASALLATALVTQWLCSRIVGLDRFDPRSAAITALSLCLLLRTTEPAVAALAAVIAIASKFVLRIDGRHVWNPSALALVLLLLSRPDVWVSPGQWGAGALALFAIGCLGSLVVTRAARADVSLAFLIAYGALVAARSAWLGEPPAIVAHRLSNGGLLLFAFFMISDPKTTPSSRAGRIAFASVVALGAFVVHFVLFRTNGLLWSLVVLSPLVPLVDRWLPGRRHAWPGEATVATGRRGETHAKHPPEARRPVPVLPGGVAHA